VKHIIDGLELIVRFTGKAADVDRPMTVRTTDPRRDLVLTLGPEAVAPSPSGPESDPDLELPAESFIRLVYGRLDPDHTPVLKRRDILAALRQAFPGP
jgi:MDMPI C-terminal domain